MTAPTIEQTVRNPAASPGSEMTPARGIVERGAVGVAQQPRIPDVELIAALRQVAQVLHVGVLSSHAYERYRERAGSWLPSSSVIRKWLGGWAGACGRAGLTAPDEPLSCIERRREHERWRVEAVRDLRAAWWAAPCGLTARRYSEWLAALPKSERLTRVRVDDIGAVYGPWDAALEAAGILRDDAFHPSASKHACDPAWMWTVGEVRRLVQSFARQHGGKIPTESTWRVRPGGALPPWHVIQDLVPPLPAGAPRCRGIRGQALRER